MSTKPPQPPSDLAAAGRRLWREIVAEYELSPAEMAILREACRTADECERIRIALAAAEPTTLGSTGQERGNPLLGEARRHREQLSRLISALALPKDSEQVGLTPASRRAQHAAQTRWAAAAARKAQRGQSA